MRPIHKRQAHTIHCLKKLIEQETTCITWPFWGGFQALRSLFWCLLTMEWHENEWTLVKLEAGEKAIPEESGIEEKVEEQVKPPPPAIPSLDELAEKLPEPLPEPQATRKPSIFGRFRGDSAGEQSGGAERRQGGHVEVIWLGPRRATSPSASSRSNGWSPKRGRLHESSRYAPQRFLHK